MNVYKKSVIKYESIDIYRICVLYDVTNPAVAHAVKKLLCAGKRGAKGERQDLLEAAQSIERAIAMIDEEGEA